MRALLGVASGAVISLLALELLFRCVPVFSGVRLETTTPAMPFTRTLPEFPYVYSFGWSMANARHGQTNKQGFNNSADFADNAQVLVVGDSYIESYMLNYPDTLQGRLATQLGGRTYAAAASGNGMADALELVRYYASSIHPKNIVLFVQETNLIGVFDEAGRGHSGFALDGGEVKIVHNPYVESSSKLKMLKSALVRYVYYNLKARDVLALGARAAATAGPPPAIDAATLDKRNRILAYYFQELARIRAASGANIVFAVDGNRKTIYQDKRGGPVWRADDREYFIAQAKLNGFPLADLQPVFARHWQQTHERMDFLPMDGHWNSVAHMLAAQEVLPLIQR